MISSGIYPADAAPPLVPGVWTRIGPSSVPMTAANHVFCSNENEPIFWSAESDGLNWKSYAFNGATQRFSAQAFEMSYDAQNHIMYSASWHEGLLALKIP